MQDGVLCEGEGRQPIERALQEGRLAIARFLVDSMWTKQAGHGIGADGFTPPERGMSAMDAIKAATSVAAKYMDLADDVGAIEAGRYGDLIAVKGNPLENIERLQHVEVVIKSGNRIK